MNLCPSSSTSQQVVSRNDHGRSFELAGVVGSVGNRRKRGLTLTSMRSQGHLKLAERVKDIPSF